MSGNQTYDGPAKALGVFACWLAWAFTAASKPWLGVVGGAGAALLGLALVMPGWRSSLYGAFGKQETPSAPAAWAGLLLLLAVTGMGVGGKPLAEQASRFAAGVAEDRDRDRRFDDALDRARAASEAKDHAAASRAFAEATKIQALAPADRSSYASVLKSLGDAHTVASETSQALAAYQQAVALAPDLNGLSTAIKETEDSEAEAQMGRGAALAEGGRWGEAVDAYVSASSLRPSLPGLQEALAAANAKVEEVRERRRREERHRQLEAAIEESRAIAKDKAKCDTPKLIADAWMKLRTATREDKLFGRARAAAKGLERCRRKTKRTLDRGLQKFMVDQRKEIRSTLDDLFLQSGMDVKVRVHGTKSTRVTLTYVFFSNRVVVHNLLEDGNLLQLLQKVGFKKLTFSDGFQYSTSVSLDPAVETNGGQAAMDGLGIGEPLVIK